MDDFTDHDDDDLTEWIRYTDKVPMSALFGDKPEDGIFTGAMTGRMIQAAGNDAIEQMRADAHRDSPLETYSVNDLVTQAAMYGAMHAARRIAMELKGCTIDPDHDPDI